MNYIEFKHTVERARHWGFQARPRHKKYSPYNRIINAAIQGTLTVNQLTAIYQKLPHEQY